MTDFERDLKTKWTPSPQQDADAATALAASGEEYVYTVHILVGKEHGWWTDGITVEHMARVFTDRESASAAAQGFAEFRHVETSKPVTGGYTLHSKASSEGERTVDGREWQTRWAVFEDILATFPVPSWSSRAKTG